MIPDLRATVLGVSTGRVGDLGTGRRSIPSAFVKTPVAGRVALGRLGLPGDEHVYEHHGGPDMALLDQPVEHYAAISELGPVVGDLALLQLVVWLGNSNDIDSTGQQWLH